MRRIIGLILIVALTVLATLAETMRNNLWTSYRNYTSPYLTDLPAGSARSPITQRMVLVLVRGLRLDTSLQMSALKDMRERGSDLVVMHDPPTYRLPTWETLFSGARADVHGSTTDFGTHATNAPSTLFSALQLVGQTSAIVGSQELGDVFASEVQRFVLVDNADIANRDDDAVRQAQEVLNDTANPVRLLCVELTAIEQTMLMNPANTQAAISVTDTRIKTLMDSLNLNVDALVVMSDRGLSARLTDGGAETEVAQTPLVLAGSGVAPASQVLIKATDVAPTLATLLGVPMPVHAQGEVALAALSLPETVGPLVFTPTETLSSTQVSTDSVTSNNLDTANLAPANLAPLPGALWASAVQLTTFYENWSEVIHQPRFAAELLRAQQQAIRDGNTDAYQKLMIDINARADAAYQARIGLERVQRLPVAIGAVLLLLILVGVLLSSRRWQVFFGTALYLVIWYVVFILLRGDRFSLSMFAGSDPLPFLTMWQRNSSFFLMIVCAFVALTTGRDEDGLEAITTVLSVVLLIVAVQAVLVVWFYFQWGSSFTWTLPDSSTLVTALMALTQVCALSLRLVPELPNIPVPLVIGFITLGIYSLVHNRNRRARYGRLR